MFVFMPVRLHICLVLKFAMSCIGECKEIRNASIIWCKLCGVNN